MSYKVPSSPRAIARTVTTIFRWKSSQLTKITLLVTTYTLKNLSMVQIPNNACSVKCTEDIKIKIKLNLISAISEWQRCQEVSFNANFSFSGRTSLNGELLRYVIWQHQFWDCHRGSSKSQAVSNDINRKPN